jgi:hypothetical protein
MRKLSVTWSGLSEICLGEGVGKPDLHDVPLISALTRRPG